MATAALIIATIVDLALAALAIAVFGFIVGAGPESMHAGIVGEAVLAAFVAFCVLAPIAGFALRSCARPVGGILVAWLLPLAAGLALPPPF